MKRFSALVLAVIVCAALASPAFAGAKKLTTAAPDGVSISYTVQGKGEPALVFVHCWCGDQTYWRGQVPYFEKKHKVVTLDLAGHGESGMGRKDYTVQSFAGDVAAVVKAAGLKKVILIGHSMGGPVNLEAARLLPGTVIGLVGVDTYQDFGEKYEPEVREKYVAAFNANFKGVTDRFVRSMFAPGADTTLETQIATDISSCPPEVGANAMGNMLQYDAMPAVKELKIPIRCVNADLFPTKVEENKSVAYSFEVKYMPGHGHFLLLEDPATFNKLLDETIAEIVNWKR